MYTDIAKFVAEDERDLVQSGLKSGSDDSET
jgi:hypothetical protein